MATDRLEAKKILIVDDEPDILDSLEDLLPMCQVVRAQNFNEAKAFLETQQFDLTVLDIMGVQGYDLLNIANDRNVTAVMLTAKALSVEDTVRSYKQGAAYYVPKDKMAEIAIYLSDVLEAQEKGKGRWWRWLDRFSDYYSQKFGVEWDKERKGDDPQSQLPWHFLQL